MSTAAEITTFLGELHRIHDHIGTLLDAMHGYASVGAGTGMSPTFDLAGTATGLRIGSRHDCWTSVDPDDWELADRADVCRLTISAGVLLDPAGCTAVLTVTAFVGDTAISPYPAGHHVLHEARQDAPDSTTAMAALTGLVAELPPPVGFLKQVGVVADW